MFKSNNRYRDVIASPEGNTLYVLTDTAGNVQKDDGSVTHTLENPVLSLNLHITVSNLFQKPSYIAGFYIKV